MKDGIGKKKLIIFLGIAALGFGDAQEKKMVNIYNPVGKRDPFKVLSSLPLGRKIAAIYPTEKYDLDQLALKAILRIGGKSRAMVQAPDGLTFVLYEGEMVGRERATLSRILKTEIIFSQQTANYLGNQSLVERVMSLPPEEILAGSETESGKIEKNRDVSSSKGPINNLPTSSKKIIEKVLDRPNQLEKQLEEAMGSKNK
jgi:hypothetical protein